MNADTNIRRFPLTVSRSRAAGDVAYAMIVPERCATDLTLAAKYAAGKRSVAGLPVYLVRFFIDGSLRMVDPFAHKAAEALGLTALVAELVS